MHDKLLPVKDDSDFQRSREVALSLSERYDVDLVRLFELLSEKEIFIPLSVFNPELSALETVSKYLHENLGMTFRRIAQLTNRSEKTIWQAYNISLRKFGKRLSADQTLYLIPVSVIANRKFSNLESIVLFAKEQYGLRFSELGNLLHRDQRTVWTVYNRALRKRAQ
jgi:hypothetical protein